MTAAAVAAAKSGGLTAANAAGYTAAVIAHGGAVRASVTRSAEAKWDKAGCGDGHLAGAESRLSAATAAAAGTPYSSPERDAADAEFQAVRKLCDRRRELYVESVLETVGAARELGGDLSPMLDPAVKVPKADRDLLAAVTARIPAGMLAALAEREPPDRHHTGKLRLTRTQSAYRGGFFRARSPITETLDCGRVADPDMLVVRGRAAGEAILETPAGAPADLADLADRGYDRLLRDDTPENRAELEDKISQAAKYEPQLRKRGRRPKVVAAEGKLAVVLPSGRATRDTGQYAYEVCIRPGEADVLAHELGHMLEENNPEIQLACLDFLNRRTAGLAPETVPARGAMNEYSYTADHFVDAYVGRHYAGAIDEVFSIGLEAVLTGTRGGLAGLEQATRHADGGGQVVRTHPADPEHLALMLGLLTTANQQVPVPADPAA